MSRLNDLLRQLEARDASLAKDLRREVDALSNRRAFGLNFERHVPEAVELSGRPVRRGDKVRILPPRGSSASAGDDLIWRVLEITKDGSGPRIASLELLDNTEETSQAFVDDLVVIAEFRDPIYPGLVSTGRVERGGDKPYHAVINAENYHALQTLLFTHRAKVDVIYIDPPYNTGAKDWKYNNDYVEGEDLYRHSKWLAFMERRLKLAKELLNPADSVLIVLIDEREYLRLGLVLEQTFPEAQIQMVSIAISPSGGDRGRAFRRSDEYAFFVSLGRAGPEGQVLGPEWQGGKADSTQSLRWNGLMRSGTGASRGDRPGMFYPVFLDEESGAFDSVGDAILLNADRGSVKAPAGKIAVWPIRSDDTEGRWQVGPESARALRDAGHLRIGRFAGERTAISYLKSGEQQKLKSGVFGKFSLTEDGHIEAESASTGNTRVPTTQWNLVAHSAAEYGTTFLRSLLPGRKFPFPKSLYAVEDSLRFYVSHKPDAVIIDFFAGSGTTAHAVIRLNKQDGGRRGSISVTNNEVGADEQRQLRDRGLRPGDPEWEQWGICDYITKARITAAITGTTPTGDPIQGNYKFTDEFPLADGFQENVEFFTLTYEAPLRVSSNREFPKIAPLLWLRAGSRGRRIEHLSAGWDVADSYGVLADLNHSDEFIQTVAAADGIRMAFIITDEDRLFEAVVRELPEQVEPVRLYEAYLQNFEIETMRSAL